MEKLLPQNIEAECGVLGSIIIDPEAVLDIDFLRADDFYRDAHRTIFETVLELLKKHEPPDFITICDVLKAKGKLQEIGGASYITSLINQVPTSRHAEHYGHIVEHTSIRRQLIQISGETAGDAYDNDEYEDTLNKAMKRLNDLVSRSQHSSALTKIAKPLEEYMNRVRAVADNGVVEQIAGIKTGYNKLDSMIFKAGFKKTNFVVIAARPGIGKTTMLLNVALHTARSTVIHPLTGMTRKRAVVIFSLEMSEDELINSLLSQLSGINSQQLDPDVLNISADEWEPLIYAEDVLSELDLYIDCTPGLSCMDIETRLLKLQQELGEMPDLVCVDYLQRMNTNTGKSSGSRVTDVGGMSNGLKDLAMKLNTVVLCAVQLNRDNEERANKEPQLSDMKDSGNVEQDANIVIGIHREDAYDNDTERKGIADVIVLKYRKGQTGRVEMFADYPHSRFIDIAEEG